MEGWWGLRHRYHHYSWHMSKSHHHCTTNTNTRGIIHIGNNKYVDCRGHLLQVALGRILHLVGRKFYCSSIIILGSGVVNQSISTTLLTHHYQHNYHHLLHLSWESDSARWRLFHGSFDHHHKLTISAAHQKFTFNVDLNDTDEGDDNLVEGPVSRQPHHWTFQNFEACQVHFSWYEITIWGIEHFQPRSTLYSCTLFGANLTKHDNVILQFIKRTDLTEAATMAGAPPDLLFRAILGEWEHYHPPIMTWLILFIVTIIIIAIAIIILFISNNMRALFTSIEAEPK